jgi:PPOX class probable F420-dependent enzyme
MPGYGVLGPKEGTGLLPWEWAERRLVESRDYWIATAWPDGRPHLTAVWGVWDGGRLLIACSRRSRKARNLRSDPRCSAATEDPDEPVVVDGWAERVCEAGALDAFVALVNSKYGTGYGPEGVDPAANATFAIRPVRVIALTEADFTGSPTRWTFGEA